jgi:predicted ATPase
MRTVPAVALFVDRARAVDASFRIDGHNAGAIARICRELDGIPLAIELAAARVRALSPAELVERLDDRLRLLTGGTRDAPAHQQTLRATMEWSYALLDEPERAMLRRCAMFAGGFDLEAAAAIAAAGEGETDALDRLSSLVDKSLVSADFSAKPTRYSLLESTRAFAL